MAGFKTTRTAILDIAFEWDTRAAKHEQAADDERMYREVGGNETEEEALHKRSAGLLRECAVSVRDLVRSVL